MRFVKRRAIFSYIKQQLMPPPQSSARFPFTQAVSESQTVFSMLTSMLILKFRVDLGGKYNEREVYFQLMLAGASA